MKTPMAPINIQNVIVHIYKANLFIYIQYVYKLNMTSKQTYTNR